MWGDGGDMWGDAGGDMWGDGGDMWGDAGGDMWGDDDGYWRRRKRSPSNKMYSFYVDETVGSLTMDLVFKTRLTGSLDSSITVEPPVDREGCVAADRKTVGNLLHFKLECPCVGEWSVHIPRPNRYLLQSFNAQTYGEFSIDFDIAFEHVSLSDITEYPVFPCAGERIKVRVTMLQAQSVDREYGVTLILITERNMVTSHSLTGKPRREVWTALITVPVESFTVAVRGRTTEGNNFLRMRNKKVNPVETCLTTEWLPPYHVLKIGEEALIILSLKNIYGSDTYYLYCINEHQNRGVKAEIARPQSARLFVTQSRQYYIYIKVNAYQGASIGETVRFTCGAIANGTGKKFSKTYEFYILAVVPE